MVAGPLEQQLGVLPFTEKVWLPIYALSLLYAHEPVVLNDGLGAVAICTPIRGERRRGSKVRSLLTPPGFGPGNGDNPALLQRRIASGADLSACWRQLLHRGSPKWRLQCLSM